MPNFKKRGELEKKWVSQVCVAIIKEARAEGVAHLFRLPGHCRDMPAALAAADIVVAPAIEPPILGRSVAQAQAMAMTNGRCFMLSPNR